MINVEAELSKYKNCKDRDELSRQISNYKNLARQHAKDIVAAGQYNRVALKLREMCDKLPAPRLKNVAAGSHGTPVKTAAINSDEQAKISAAWKQKTKK
ncbi:MAG: hypothetical protein LBH42_09305 [Treponema sp.]|jgi:hypothetical protein|nr:hypothetical protein [Treponema sp.]